MTKSHDAASAPERGTAIALLVFTAVLLLPLAGAWYYLAREPLHYNSGTGFRASRETVMWFAHAAMLIVVVPCAGAGLAWTAGAALRRRRAVWAATGALIGTVGLWIAGIVAFGEAFSNSSFDF
ncbi:hypothetical protein ACWCP6_27110 [Streptomyces sp. NPDC002004]